MAHIAFLGTGLLGAAFAEAAATPAQTVQGTTRVYLILKDDAVVNAVGNGLRPGLMLESAGDLPLAVLPGVAARTDQLIAAGHGARVASVVALDAVV